MIIVNLDVMLAKRKMSLNELTARVGLTQSNMSILKTGKSRSIKFHTLNKLCYILDCEPADILEFRRVEGEDYMKDPFEYLEKE